MPDKDPPPDHLRCKRTDGRQWRCKRRAMVGLTVCDIHHLQGTLRSNKQKVPESLKLERNVTKKKGKKEAEKSKIHRIAKLKKLRVEKTRRELVSETLDRVLNRLKLKKGDLQLELIRVFLKRQLEKKKENVIADETREFQLPNGVMAISQSPSKVSERNDVLDIKLGVENGNFCMQRHFRSKNLEPLPVSTMQVVPFAEIIKKRRMKKCHLCRKSKNRCLTKCLTCKKRFFCMECIKERHLEKQEVKEKCPACRGTCGCKLCMKRQNEANNDKEGHTSESKPDRIQLLQCLIYMLLPMLKQVNRDQSIELEREAKITRKNPSEIHIPQTQFGSDALLLCDRCETSIVDYHRTCTNCSYIICLSCCRELSQRGLSENFKLETCKKRKKCSSSVGLYEQNVSGKSSTGVPCHQRIPCLPTDIGGCGENLLDLRSIFPFTWTRDLEVRAEEILYNYEFQETSDDSLSCLLCNENDSEDSELKCERVGFCDNYLYCPTMKDLHQETFKHFQNHWGKGHPVIVRNMLQSTAGLCWDPVIMFCSYLESKSFGFCNTNNMEGSNCLDWCEVEIDKKCIFMGSLEKRTHASMIQKVLKFKAWFSSHVFQKEFPLHYNEILSALPLQEYINPVSGLLNLGVKFPREFPKPDLGPGIYFSFGGPEELGQAGFLSKLHYEAHDMVNIMAHATDIPVSPEQIITVENLLKKYKARDNHKQSFSNSSSQKGKSSLQSEETGESGLHDVGEKMHQANGNKNNKPFYSDDRLKGQSMAVVENGNLSEDSESDEEALTLCCGSIEKSEVDEYFQGEDVESTGCSKDKQCSDSCGAQWDIFRRQDVSKLLEYLKRHSNELSSACSYSKLDHPILDQSIFLDAYHKLRLKEEFDIEPWTFEQCPGEAIFIPAGCPYQIRKTKSCVNVVLDFISPESATHCIQLRNEICALPTRHKVNRKLFEVEKMAFHGVNTAIEDLRNLTHAEQVVPPENPFCKESHS